MLSSKRGVPMRLLAAAKQSTVFLGGGRAPPFNDNQCMLCATCLAHPGALTRRLHCRAVTCINAHSPHLPPGAGPRRRRLVAPPDERGAYVASHALHKLPYGPIANAPRGVMFLTCQFIILKYIFLERIHILESYFLSSFCSRVYLSTGAL
jgi:hypothetical protein